MIMDQLLYIAGMKNEIILERDGLKFRIKKPINLNYINSTLDMTYTQNAYKSLDIKGNVVLDLGGLSVKVPCISPSMVQKRSLQ